MSAFTIGEVLNRLQGEFPEITVSKIRFLETEGLIEPDRTPAGYRQFTEGDVDRLQYVLRAQRDRHLPLRVIGKELERLDAGEDPLAVVTGADVIAEAVRGNDPSLLVPDEDGEQTSSRPAPRTATAATKRPRATASMVGGDVQLSGREIAEAAGLELRDVRGLQEHGLLPPGDVFDGDGLAAAKAAAGLLSAGLEPRHLRMYRQFGDREVSLFAQLVQPILRQRNPAARAQATELLDALAAHGTDLHAALLRREVRDLLRS